MLYQYYFEFVKNNIYKFVLYIILHIYIPLSQIGLPHFYGKLISTVKNGKFDNIKKVFFSLVFIWIIIQTLNICKSYVNSFLFPDFLGFTRTKILGKVLDSYKSDYIDIKTGKLLSKVIDSPYILFNMAKESKNLVMNNLLSYISTFCYLFYYDKFISLVYLICLILVIFMTYIYVSSCKNFIRDSENLYTDSNEEVDDTIINLISVYTSNKVKDEKNRLKSINNKYINSEKTLHLCNTKYRIFFSIAFVIIFIVLNYFSLKIYIEKKIKLETLSAIVIINYSILTGFMSIFYDTKDFIDNKERVDLLDDYLNEMPTPPKNTRINSDKTKNILKKPYLKVELRNVSFKYKEKKVFDNLNLIINQKDNLGLIGNIGSGKSTLVKLIVGLKTNYTGTILINDVDIKNISIDKLRNYITYIPQHPKLFNRTLYENITYGLKGITEEKIYQVLEEVNLNSLKDEFKKKMHKKVGKTGSNLSGGQRQIVWLIRSLLKNNRMIILDEPTSSLDKNNKMKVVNLIEKLSESRNIILITHDMDILKNMNRIIKLDKGKIIEDKKI